MSSKKIKQYRKTAEKVAKDQAFIMAQHQILEIMNAPFKFRFKFAWKILFPPKNKLITPDVAAAHGLRAAELAVLQAGKLN